MPYTINDHQHRFAAWAASRAASPRGVGLKVQQGVCLLESCGFNADFSGPNQLPKPQDLDEMHKKWRTTIIQGALGLNLTHGVAAKLINVYLKIRFVCAGQEEHERVKRLHPPVDRLLFKELARENVGGFRTEWRKFLQEGWSRFDSDTYEKVICLIRESLPNGEPLWKIEEHWPGYQE